MLGVISYTHILRQNAAVVHLVFRKHIYKLNYYEDNSKKMILEKFNFQCNKHLAIYNYHNTLIKDKDFNVPSERIVRDLWVLKYHHETIQARLYRVKEAGIDNLYPWMVRCSEDILNRFITLSQETRNILGDSKSAKLYLANRLNTTPQYIEETYNKIPALKSVRVPKVKKFLDYLISEGFHIEDIANKPRVLITSQTTVETRIEKLRELGLKEINLNVLCKSTKAFEKYCDLMKSALKQNG